VSAEIVLLESEDALALKARRKELTAARTELAEAESELAQVRAQLAAFEGRYLRQVGVLYAELDALEARIAEREAEREGSDAARLRAAEARRRAEETHEAAYGEAAEAEAFEPGPELKRLFREVAKRVHPDFARDEAELKFFTALMARANLAYERGDAATLERMLDDHREIHASVAGESVAAEMLRVSRQIQQAGRDIARLGMEREALLGGEVGQLWQDAEAAAREHRDLLLELATGLRLKIAEAERRLAGFGGEAV
jgi:hypothetical protein